MNKKELIAQVSEKINTTKKETGEYIDAIFEVISEALVKGQDVKLSGFGTFTVVERAERNGINPSTGESIVIPASKAPKFKASALLKNAVKGN